MDVENLFPKIIFKTAINQFDLHSESKCLCLSGKLYKNCCKTNVDSLNETTRDYGVISKKNGLKKFQDAKKRTDKRSAPNILGEKIEKRARKKLSFCFIRELFSEDYFSVNCSSKIIKAHTIAEQNLKKLQTEIEELYTFNDHAFVEEFEIDHVDLFYKKIAPTTASKYTMFCGNHDNLIFSEIENNNHVFVKKEKEYIEALEYSIKAASFELYYKLLQIFYLAEYFIEIKEIYNSDFIEAYKNAIDYYCVFKEHLKRLVIDYKEYTTYGKVNVEFKYDIRRLQTPKIEFSLSECMSDNCDEVVFINVFNNENAYVVLSTYSDFSRKFEDYELIEYILINSTNIFFNKEFFENLSIEEESSLFKFRRGLNNFEDEINLLSVLRKLLH